MSSTTRQQRAQLQALTDDMMLSTKQIFLAQLVCDSAEECPICCDALSRPTTTTCGHTFCLECIRHWLTNANTCPYCRKELYTDMEQPLRRVVEFVDANMVSEPLTATLPPGTTAQTVDLLTERLDRLARDVIVKARRDHLNRNKGDDMLREYLLQYANEVDMEFDNGPLAVRFFLSRWWSYIGQELRAGEFGGLRTRKRDLPLEADSPDDYTHVRVCVSPRFTLTRFAFALTAAVETEFSIVIEKVSDLEGCHLLLARYQLALRRVGRQSLFTAMTA